MTRTSEILLLSPADEALLAHLATYRFLTTAQAVTLGVGNPVHVRERFRRLNRLGFTDSLPHSPFTGPAIHWLTAKGAGEVQALGLMPEGATPQFLGKAYRGGAYIRQRAMIVDCHIALRRWATEAGFLVDFFKAEFERQTGSEKEFAPATRIAIPDGNYTPDALCKLTGEDGRQWLFALEVETGGVAVGLGNHRRRLAERLRIVEEYAVEKAMKWPADQKRLRMLFVFADDAMLARAMKIVPQPLSGGWRGIYLKSFPHVLSDFGSGWWQMDGKNQSPFG